MSLWPAGYPKTPGFDVQFGPMLSKKVLRLAPNSDSADSEGQGLGGSDDGSAEGRSGESFL